MLEKCYLNLTNSNLFENMKHFYGSAVEIPEKFFDCLMTKMELYDNILFALNIRDQVSLRITIPESLKSCVNINVERLNEYLLEKLIERINFFAFYDFLIVDEQIIKKLAVEIGVIFEFTKFDLKYFEDRVENFKHYFTRFSEFYPALKIIYNLENQVHWINKNIYSSEYKFGKIICLKILLKYCKYQQCEKIEKMFNSDMLVLMDRSVNLVLGTKDKFLPIIQTAYECLLVACKTNNLPLVKLLVEKKVNILVPVLYSIIKADTNIIELLFNYKNFNNCIDNVRLNRINFVKFHRGNNVGFDHIDNILILAIYYSNFSLFKNLATKICILEDIVKLHQMFAISCQYCNFEVADFLISNAVINLNGDINLNYQCDINNNTNYLKKCLDLNLRITSTKDDKSILESINNHLFLKFLVDKGLNIKHTTLASNIFLRNFPNINDNIENSNMCYYVLPFVNNIYELSTELLKKYCEKNFNKLWHCDQILYKELYFDCKIRYYLKFLLDNRTLFKLDTRILILLCLNDVFNYNSCNAIEDLINYIKILFGELAENKFGTLIDNELINIFFENTDDKELKNSVLSRDNDKCLLITQRAKYCWKKYEFGYICKKIIIIFNTDDIMLREKSVE